MQRRNSRYPDLTPHQNYVVIGIEADDLRILNDQGRPYLYPSRLFEVVSSYEPNDWVTELGDDGERYAYPAPLNGRGFFEDFFDDKKEAVAAFWQIVNQRLATASVAVKAFRKKASPPVRIGTGQRSAQQPVI
jgi:hypothetical protein